MNIYLVGNDIEIDGEKVARVLDIRSTLKDKLAEALENAIAESKKEFDDGYEQGANDAKSD